MTSSSPPYSDEDWHALLRHLPPEAERLAHEHGVIHVQWPNTKVHDAATLLRFILLHVGADIPLRQTVTLIAEAGGPSLAPVWLHKRMRRAEPYLAELVELMLGDGLEEATPERWGGYEMLSLDATTVSGPGAEGSDVRLHCVLRLHDLRVRRVCVTPTSAGETFRNFLWEPETLVIADRCYANAPGILWAVDQGATVLVRVNRGALPLTTPTNKAIDVLSWCRGLGDDVCYEQPAIISHISGKKDARKERKLEGRLIGFRLPREQALAARERTRREEGPSVTAAKLEAAEYVVLFTTAPADRMSAERCIEAYRLRWQIELQFKRWKSLCHFDKLPNYRDDTMLAWVTAKLLLGLLLDRVAAAQDGNATSRPGARQPWKITSLIWPLLLAALLPIGLANAIALVPAMARRLDSLDDVVTAARQVDVFRWQQEELEGLG